MAASLLAASPSPGALDAGPWLGLAGGGAAVVTAAEVPAVGVPAVGEADTDICADGVGVLLALELLGAAWGTED